jgi:hypothetical protein
MGQFKSHSQSGKPDAVDANSSAIAVSATTDVLGMPEEARGLIVNTAERAGEEAALALTEECQDAYMRGFQGAFVTPKFQPTEIDWVSMLGVDPFAAAKADQARSVTAEVIS